jgi:glycosyltransferase involved in cell wall biosynthesis
MLRSVPVAPDPRLDRAAQALSDCGDEISVLGWDRMADSPVFENLSYGSITRLRLRSGYARGSGNAGPIIIWSFWLLWSLWRRRQEYDLIHACNFDTVLPALVMQLLFRKIVVYDIFDFYPEMLRATPRWIVKLIRALDLWAIGQADAVILADDCRRDQIRGANPKSVTVIYNSPRDALAEMERQMATAQEIADSLRIAFVGLLHVERGLVQLLQVLSSHPDWHLDLAGFGGDEDIILPMAENLPNVTFHGRVGYERALALMHRADTLIATYDPSIPNHRYASPNKLFEAMMLAKPIIVARGTSMDRIVERHECGLVVEYGNLSALESAMERLEEDPGLGRRLGAAGREAYEGEYSWEIMRQRLLGLYRTL